MLKITGVMLLALGLVAGLVLVASPFGMLPFARSSFSAWVLFPTSFAAGSVLLALASPRTALGWLQSARRPAGAGSHPRLPESAPARAGPCRAGLPRARVRPPWNEPAGLTAGLGRGA